MLLQCVCCPTEANKRASTRQPHLIHNIGKTGILESIFAKFTVVSKSCSGFSMTGNTRVTGNENLWGGKKTHLNNDNSNFCRVNLHSASQPRRQINTWKNKKMFLPLDNNNRIIRANKIQRFQIRDSQCLWFKKKQPAEQVWKQFIFPDTQYCFYLFIFHRYCSLTGRVQKGLCICKLCEGEHTAARETINMHVELCLGSWLMQMFQCQCKTTNINTWTWSKEAILWTESIKPHLCQQ